MEQDKWAMGWFRPLLISLMCGCVAVGVVDLLSLSAPGWDGTYIVVGCFLVALEAQLSYWIIQRREIRSGDLWRFRLTEIGVFLILLKLASYVGRSRVEIVLDILNWSKSPLDIISTDVMIGFALLLVVWWASTQTARDLDSIGEPPTHDRFYVPPTESVANRFFWGGGALLFTAGLARIAIADRLGVEDPPVPQIVLNVLLYFLLGLTLLGQLQFAKLRHQWETQRVKVDTSALFRRWARYTLISIGLAALVAFLLPTRYTVGLLEVASAVLYFISYVLFLLGILISLILSFLCSPLAWLFGQGKRPERGTLDPEMFRLEREMGRAAFPAWYEVAKSLLFWGVLLGMVFYVVRSYLRDRPELLRGLASLKLVRALRGFLSALWRRLRGLTAGVADYLPRRFQEWRARRGLAPSAKPFGFFRLGALSFRERVLYYYLSILERAGRQGFPRRRAQTPYEYDASFSPLLDEAQPEMEQMTEAFVEARYSRHPFGRERERDAHARWQRVKAALRALKQPSR